MHWADSIRQLSQPALRTLSSWSLGTQAAPLVRQLDEFTNPDIPDDVYDGGAPALIDYALEHFPDKPATKYWSAVDDRRNFPDIGTARQLTRSFYEDTNWYPGFAVAALGALDMRGAWDAEGILLGLEVSRGILTRAETVAITKLRAELIHGGNMETPLDPRDTPFWNPVIQETLNILDSIVAVQERQEDRPPQVLDDMARCFGPQSMGFYGEARRRMNIPPRGTVGSYITLQLRALMEDALVKQELDLIQRLDRMIIPIAARYGFTSDVLHAAERSVITNAHVFQEMANGLTISVALEHFLAGALWLRDTDLEATIRHGLALVLRSGSRKVPGLLDAVCHMQRSISLRRQNGETIQAYGDQIDLTSILMQLSSLADKLADAPAEVANWETATEKYLEDAIYHLGTEQHRTAKLYLGEAFHNRSRLYQLTNRKDAAAENARAALDIAKETDQQDLEARALYVLAAVDPQPAQALDYYAEASRLVQKVRREIDNEQITVAWVGNKQGLFSSQLDYILDQGSKILSEDAVCEILINALEEGRGLTYNRWLGVSENVNRTRVEHLLNENPDLVLAVYAVTNRHVGLVVLSSGNAPRLHTFDLTANAIDQMVGDHLDGLNQQGWTRLPMWDASQAAFLQVAIPLVAPLEPYVAAGKTICFIPHRTLHSVNLHTVPTQAGAVPIGLRTPVFSNPSLTNWFEAQQAEKGIEEGGRKSACVAGAWPREEADYFDDVTIAAESLRGAGFQVKQLHDDAATLDGMVSDGEPWLMLHLACHGVFRHDREISGLMLSADGQPPPVPSGVLREDLNHLATPNRLRTARVAGRITFLTSCVSARNIELPGDDLMGITRALFANGAVVLIAGAWTVVSGYVQPFTEQFYKSLLEGRATAEAILQARQKVAHDQPDPFYWGCFISQGANARLTDAGVKHVS
jgi:CHAT domain-containing protein